MKLASDLRQGDIIWLECVNGRTRARIVEAVEEPDPTCIFPDPGPVRIGLHLSLQRAIRVPSVPQWKTNLFSIWVDHNAQFETIPTKGNSHVR